MSSAMLRLRNLSTRFVFRPDGLSISCSGGEARSQVWHSNALSSLRMLSAAPATPYLPCNNFSTSSSDDVFKSSISLDKLYPNSSLNINKPTVPEEKDPTKFSGFIPMNKIKISHSKSSGPGGQNVNVLNTKVEIRFHLQSAEWIPEQIRQNMLSKFHNTISKEGYFIVVSDRTRFQHLNTADALEKLREMIRSAEPIVAAELSPETLEKLRRKREKAARERLHQKRSRSDIKSSRGAVSADF